MKLTDFSIRPLNTADEPALWIMLYQAIHVAENEPRPPMNIIFRPELARYVSRWGRPGDSGWIALDPDNLPAGAVWLRLWSEDNRGYGWVDDQSPELSIAVLPEYRGLGIGTLLINHALKDALERYPAVSLSVSQDNPAANLYQRLGFEVVGQDGSSLTMRKVSGSRGTGPTG